MLLGFAIIIGALGALMLLERRFPDRPLPVVPYWWQRVLLINVFQLVAVILGMYTWESVLAHYPFSMMQLRDHLTPAWGGFVAYLVNTWMMYWWHFWRHSSHFLWRWFHQVHHSAQRIETITSFYKHPLEIVGDSILMSTLLYPVLGLTRDSSIWLSGFSALGEYLYHMNIRTPHWWGYLFQRPESHRLHHARNRRLNGKNFADLPLWDMLNGTFENPRTMNAPTGYIERRELQWRRMLRGEDVVRPRQPASLHSRLTVFSIACLCLLGCCQTIGYFLALPRVRELGLVSTASPLPLVFTAYHGVETYSTAFGVAFSDRHNRTSLPLLLTHQVYGRLKGAYNRRNAYGVLFSHGLLFDRPVHQQMQRHILRRALCVGGPLWSEFQVKQQSIAVVHIHMWLRAHPERRWHQEIVCDL